MTTYMLLADGEEFTAVNLHNHFSEEARAKTPSVSQSTLDRFFGPGPLAAVKSNVDSRSRSSSSSSSTTTDQHPSFKTLFWLVDQPWYDERWELRTDLINNYSLCGDIDSVSSDLTEEFELNTDHQENLSSCSSITDTCLYRASTSTSTVSTLDDDDNVVNPLITSFASLSSLSSNSFSDIESELTIMSVGNAKKPSLKKAPKKSKTAKDQGDKRKLDGKDGKRKHKRRKKVSITQSSDEENETENETESEDEIEKHDGLLHTNGDSDSEKNSDDDSSDDEEDVAVETMKERTRTGGKGGMIDINRRDDSYDIDTVDSRVMELQAENKNLKEQLNQMKQQMTYSLSTKARKKKDLTREQRQMLSEVGSIMRKVLFRTIKFPIVGWDKYSEKSNSCCGKVLSTVKLPPGADENLKRLIWDDLIKPELPSMLGSRKNDMLQDMRKQHESK